MLLSLAAIVVGLSVWSFLYERNVRKARAVESLRWYSDESHFH